MPIPSAAVEPLQRGPPKSRALLLALGFFALLAVPAVCWIIPYRLSHSEFSSEYTFGYIGDEYFYAQRMAPLIAGTSPTNPLNGVSDPGIVSPLFLEDACRSFMTFTGMDIITFVWAWRIVFPLALGMSFFVLARACIYGRRRSWHLALVAASGGAAMGLALVLYDVFQSYPPMQGWIQRTPTNCEYIFAVLFAAAFVAFIKRRHARQAVLLGVSGALLVYFRIYAAFPWAIAAALGTLVLLLQRRLTLRTALLAGASLALCLVPWALVQFHNSGVPAFEESYARYFSLPGLGQRRAYDISHDWIMLLAISALLCVLAIPLRRRVFALVCAATVAVLPFLAGLPSFSSELIHYSRFGVFYLIAIVAALVLLLSQWATAWARRGQSARIRQGTALAAGVAMLLLGVLAVEYLNVDLLHYPGGNLVGIHANHEYLPAYKWIEENTPKDALFLVDDGVDWSQIPPEDDPGWGPAMARMMTLDDLFGLVARRRRVFTLRMYTQFMSGNDLAGLESLHRGTFGYMVNIAQYTSALKKYKPSYVLWRKTAPVPLSDSVPAFPRGLGVQLAKFSRSIYSDNVCEIWRIEYSQHAGGGVQQ